VLVVLVPLEAVLQFGGELAVVAMVLDRRMHLLYVGGE